MNVATKITQYALGMILKKHVVDPLLKGECGLKDDELLTAVQAFCHIEKDIAETCTLCNECDAKTLKRWSDDPKIGFPKFHKGRGDKHYYWLDEVEMWKADHPEILERVNQKKKSI